jgi:hypothetical protein
MDKRTATAAATGLLFWLNWGADALWRTALGHSSFDAGDVRLQSVVAKELRNAEGFCCLLFQRSTARCGKASAGEIG